MKYFWAVFISLLAFTGCDDGDLIESTFNFEDVAIQKCSDSAVLYKMNGQEALILNTPESSFENVETPLNTPRVVSISGSTSIKYRKYSSTTSASNICDTPTLTVLEEWTVSGGTVEITTTKLFDPLNPTVVIGYNHSIVFKNITFVAPDKQIVYDSYTYGNYRTNVDDLHFDYSASTMQNCTTRNLIFKYNTNNALEFEVDQALFANAVTPVGSPRTAIIDNATNKVVYELYNGNLNANYFCSGIRPPTPVLVEAWTADNGVAGTSGIITVDTEATANPNVFKHTIKLYKTIFRKGIHTYSPAPDGYYTFGEYYTTL